FANLTAARTAGFVPVASVALDQGQDQNTQNAMTALGDLKQQYGAVPQGLLYIHTGNQMTVLRLADPNAALPMINQTMQAQGKPNVTADYFNSLSKEDRASMAKDAINFTSPTDANGEISQQSLNLANMRLLTLKSQIDFNGKDAMVNALQ